MPRSFCFARISRCIHVRRRDAHSHSHHSPSNSHHNLQRLRQNLSTPASDTTAFGQPSPSLTLAPLILSKTLGAPGCAPAPLLPLAWRHAGRSCNSPRWTWDGGKAPARGGQGSGRRPETTLRPYHGGSVNAMKSGGPGSLGMGV